MTPERIEQLREYASYLSDNSGQLILECLDEIERLSVNQLTEDERKRLLDLVHGDPCGTFPANWLQSLCVRLLSGGSVRVD